MPSVSYIAAGATISHGQMDSIWSEVDRKMTALMSGKSWLCSEHVHTDLMGQFFYFGTPTNPRISNGVGSSVMGTIYDHAIYESFADTLVVTSYDTANHIANVAQYAGTFDGSVSTLDGSLQAHYKVHDGERFYFWPNSGPYIRDNNGRPNRPERRYKLAVAEIVIEGVNTLDLPPAWDKFNCFRLHNLSPYPCNVTFGGDYSLDVPAYGCRAVRRETDGSGYDSSLNYFWNFRADDLRATTCQNVDPILTTMRANNVSNPSLLFPLLERFCLGTVKWIPDWSITPPATAGAAYDGTGTLLGDLITHPGTITFADIVGGVVTFRDYEFSSWSTLSAELTALGFTVAQVGKTYTIQQATPGQTTDAIAQTCNLFKKGIDIRAALNLNTVQTLDTNVLDGNPLGIAATTTLTTAQDVTRSFVSDSRSFPVFSVSYPSGDNPASTTVAETALTVDTTSTVHQFGPLDDQSDVTGAFLDGNAKSYIDRHILFTPFGPALLYTESIPPIINSISDGCEVSAAGIVTRKQARFFINHGHPFADTVNGPSGNFCYFWTGATALRYYGGIASRGYPTGVQGGDMAGNGEDFSPAKISASVSDISIQQRCDDNIISSGRFNAFKNSDNLHLFQHNVTTYNAQMSTPSGLVTERARLLGPSIGLLGDQPASRASQTGIRDAAQDCLMPLDAEHYNTFAWMINAVTRCRPLLISDVPFLFGSSTVYLTSSAELKPADCYAIGFSHDIFDALGITIKSDAQFPASWRNKAKNSRRQTNLNFNLSSATAAGDTRKYDVTWTFTGATNGGSAPLTSSSPDALLLTTDVWVTTDDVRTMAESLGFNFAQIELRMPLAVKRISSAPVGTIVPAPVVGWTSAAEKQNPGSYVIFAGYAPPPPTFTSRLWSVESARFCCALDADDIEFTSAAEDSIRYDGEPAPFYGKSDPFTGTVFDPRQPPPILNAYGFYDGGTRMGCFFRDSFTTLTGPARYSYNGAQFDDFQNVHSVVHDDVYELNYTVNIEATGTDKAVGRTEPMPNMRGFLPGYGFEQNAVMIHEFSAGFVPVCGTMFIQEEFIGPNYDAARLYPLEYSPQGRYGLSSDGLTFPLIAGTNRVATWLGLQLNEVTGDESLTANGDDLPATDGAAYFQPNESGRTFISARGDNPSKWAQYLNSQPLISL